MWTELAAVVCLLVATGTTTPITVVISGSMEPALGVGDLVLIQNHTDPAVGDVAVFWAGDTLIIHRVIDVDSDGCVQTKGDANAVDDRQFLYPSCVPRRDINGMLVASAPLIGYPFVCFSKPTLIALAVAGGALYSYFILGKRGWELIESLA